MQRHARGLECVDVRCGRGPNAARLCLTLTGDMRWSCDCQQGYKNIFQWYAATSPYKEKAPGNGRFFYRECCL